MKGQSRHTYNAIYRDKDNKSLPISGIKDNRFFSIECRPTPELFNRFASYAGLVTLVEPARLRDEVRRMLLSKK